MENRFHDSRYDFSVSKHRLNRSNTNELSFFQKNVLAGN